MNADVNPKDAHELAMMFHNLRVRRRETKRALQSVRLARKRLSAAEREVIYAKTGGRCHICGGQISDSWQADHVLAHSGGGGGSADNFLPAHPLCNNYRWDYSAEEFQYILKLGIWIRTQIEHETRIGKAAASGFLAYEVKRNGRRRSIE